MARILIAHNFKQDSWFVMCHRLAHYLAESHEVVFMSYRPFFTEKQVLMDGKLTVYSWTTRKRPVRIQDVLYFIGIYLRHRPQLVVGHFVGGNVCILVAKVLSFFQAKTLEWYHTPSSAIEYDYGKTPRFKKIMRRLRFKYFVDTVVPVSNLSAKDYRQFYGLNNFKVILNAIRDEYRGIDADMKSSVVTVGFLGRFNPVKGVDILLGLVNHLRSDQFSFRIAGEGPEQAKIKALDLPNVEYLGMLPYSRIREFIERCHLIIIPSYVDNLVTAGIEALMHKRCLVLSSQTGLAEYLCNDGDAVICDPTFEAFRDALQKLHDDREMLQRISAQGRLSFLKKFDLEAHVRKVEHLMLG